MQETLSDLGALLAEQSQLLDDSYGVIDAEAHAYRRSTNKLAEEIGELGEALGGMFGENPRKGVTHTLDDVLNELLDVAATALGAYEHFTGNTGQCTLALSVAVSTKLERLRKATKERAWKPPTVDWSAYES